MSYGGGYGSMYPPGGAMYGQQLINYPMNNYYNGYNGMVNPYSQYYPNSYMGYYNYGGYNMPYGGIPYKPSTLRSIVNRIRYGSAYNYYPGYDYLRHRGSWNEYN